MRRRSGEPSSGNATPARSAQSVTDSAYGADSLIDPVDQLRGLAHLDVLRELVNGARSERMRREKQHYQSARNAHLAAHGHELAYGCCARICR